MKRTFLVQLIQQATQLQTLSPEPRVSQKVDSEHGRSPPNSPGHGTFKVSAGQVS